LHAEGLSKTFARSPGRFYGSVLTLLVILGLAIALLVQAIGYGP
jgi:hypothetical protein